MKDEVRLNEVWNLSFGICGRNSAPVTSPPRSPVARHLTPFTCANSQIFILL